MARADVLRQSQGGRRQGLVKKYSVFSKATEKVNQEPGPQVRGCVPDCCVPTVWREAALG